MCNICENCSVEHDSSYGSGRFCSSKCARGFSTKSRRDEINEKVSAALKGRVSPLRLPEKTKNCLHCQNEFLALPNSKKKYCTRSCSSIATQRNLIETNTHKGWKSRKDNTPSWAEQFVINKLDNLKIQYERDYKINRFFADFAFLEKRIILEIDGKQHLSRVDFDKNRDLIIEKEDWKVIRIPWKHKKYELMHEAIDAFLTEYIL